MDSSMKSSSKPHVLIIGAGIAGLTLAQCLRKHDIPFSIFEHEQESARPQGWSIALHSKTLQLLQSLSDDMTDVDQVSHLIPLDLPAEIAFYVHGKKLHVESTSDSKIIRANRAKLRSWLLTKVSVNWGANVKEIRVSDEDVTIVVEKSDGSLTEVKGDVLVGGDGVNSQVRNFLVANQGLSADIRRFPVATIIAEPRIDRVQLQRQLELANSAYVAFSDDQSLNTFNGLKQLFTSQNDGGTAKEKDVTGAQYYWFLTWHDETTAAASDTNPYWTQNATQQQLLEFALKKSQSLDPRYTELIRATKAEDIRIPPLVMRDIDMTQMPVSRVTLMGDAAHAMMPFRGEGALHAMQDAFKLAQALSEVGSGTKSLMNLLDGYQKEMLNRGNEAMKLSRAAFSGNGGNFDYVWGKKLKMVTD